VNKNIACMGLAALTTLALTGCIPTSSPDAPCAAYGEDGTQLAITSYPTGAVEVSYRPLSTADKYAATGKMEGIVTLKDGLYVLDVKDLPDVSRLTSDYYRSDAAVFITTPETGSIGFTTGCITTGVDAAGIPTTLVTLPVGK